MNRLQNSFLNTAADRPGSGRRASQGDWSGEVNRGPGTAAGTALGTSVVRMDSQTGQLQMQNDLPVEVITDPISMEEAYMGSLKAMLTKNLGKYIVATFLVGTQGTQAWEGVLFDVGNDYLTIYQQSRGRYIVSDIYSLKFIEFYDTTQRDLCEEPLRRTGETWSRS